MPGRIQAAMLFFQFLRAAVERPRQLRRLSQKIAGLSQLELAMSLRVALLQRGRTLALAFLSMHALPPSESLKFRVNKNNMSVFFNLRTTSSTIISTLITLHLTEITPNVYVLRILDLMASGRPLDAARVQSAGFQPLRKASTFSGRSFDTREAFVAHKKEATAFSTDPWKSLSKTSSFDSRVPLSAENVNECVIVVDPFSTGAILAQKVVAGGRRCVRVLR